MKGIGCERWDRVKILGISKIVQFKCLKISLLLLLSMGNGPQLAAHPIGSSLLFSFVLANKADILDRPLAYFLVIAKKLEQTFLEPKQIRGRAIK